MKHLSGLDATFLYLETPEMPMHVGSLHLFDLPKGYKGDFYEDVKKHTAGRMHLAAMFRRKLELMPLDLANPVWVEDDDIDLDYHVRRIVLSRPGTMAQLESYVGRLHSNLLDRSRPLWEFYVFEGLRSGQIGFYFKVHHAAIDGAAGVAVAGALLDVTPKPREVKPPPARRKEPKHSVAQMIQSALSNTVAQYAKMVTNLPKAVKTVSSLVIPNKDAEGKRRYSWLKNFSLGPKTPLNVSITNQRSFAATSIPLAEVKQIAKQFGATVNDVVLALCSGALRRYLGDSKALPKKPLIAAVPVSLRESGNTEMNNQAAMMLCNLATDVYNPLERLKAVRASTAAAKESFSDVKSVIPTDFPSIGAPWLMSGLASLYGRTHLADNLPPIANVVVSNVPGPQFPLYLTGAVMTAYYPLSIVVHGIALNITVISYRGSLDFGFTACRKAIPDAAKIGKYLIDSHEELKKLAISSIQEQETKQAEPSARAEKRSEKAAPKPRSPRKPAAKKTAADEPTASASSQKKRRVKKAAS